MNFSFTLQFTDYNVNLIFTNKKSLELYEDSKLKILLRKLTTDTRDIAHYPWSHHEGKGFSLSITIMKKGKDFS